MIRSGRVKEYLRMRIKYNHNLATMIIDQEEYAKKIVKRFRMENAKSVRTPLPTGYSPDLHKQWKLHLATKNILSIDNWFIVIFGSWNKTRYMLCCNSNVTIFCEPQ